MASLRIRSCESARELVFSISPAGRLGVEIVGPELRGEQSVYSAEGLVEYFERLANRLDPWSGSTGWESLDGEVSLDATCSALGSVAMVVTLNGSVGGPDAWTLRALLGLELGQLPAISREVRAFFGAAHA